MTRAGRGRPRILVGAVVASAVVLATAVFCQPSGKVGRLLTRDEVATTWVGLTEDELYLVRLTLRQPEGGRVGYSFLDEPPTVLEIGSWTYDPKGSSRLTIVPKPGQARSVELSGEVIGVKMELTVSQGGWHRKVSLRQEGEWRQRWRRLVDAMGER